VEEICFFGVFQGWWSLPALPRTDRQASLSFCPFTPILSKFRGKRRGRGSRFRQRRRRRVWKRGICPSARAGEEGGGFYSSLGSGCFSAAPGSRFPLTSVILRSKLWESQVWSWPRCVPGVNTNSEMSTLTRLE